MTIKISRAVNNKEEEEDAAAAEDDNEEACAIAHLADRHTHRARTEERASDAVRPVRASVKICPVTP